MNKPQPPAIFVDVLEPLTEEDFAELSAALSEKGLEFLFEQREATPQAMLEWLLPSAVVVVITHSYFDAVIKEIGKDHYQWFKGAVSSLYKKLLAKEPETSFTTTSAGKVRVPSHFSGSLSLFFVSEGGYRVKLLFPLDVTAEDYSRSCEEFMKILSAHSEGGGNDPIVVEIERQALEKAAPASNSVSLDRVRSTVTLLVFWDRNGQMFHVVDPIASGRQKRLISRALGAA